MVLACSCISLQVEAYWVSHLPEDDERRKYTLERLYNGAQREKRNAEWKKRYDELHTWWKG